MVASCAVVRRWLVHRIVQRINVWQLLVEVERALPRKVRPDRPRLSQVWRRFQYGPRDVTERRMISIFASGHGHWAPAGEVVCLGGRLADVWRAEICSP